MKGYIFLLEFFYFIGILCPVLSLDFPEFEAAALRTIYYSSNWGSFIRYREKGQIFVMPYLKDRSLILYIAYIKVFKVLSKISKSLLIISIQTLNPSYGLARFTG